jgi:hypothetical protein
MDFRLCHLLRKKITKGGFLFEHIPPGGTPSQCSNLLVTTEQEDWSLSSSDLKKVVLTKSDRLNIEQAYTKIMLGLEGKRLWESIIVGIDPGLSIGVAIICDSLLRASLETRDINKAIDFTISAIKNNPAKMAIIRVGATGGYRRVVLLNKLLTAKPKNVTLEVVDENNTTPAIEARTSFEDYDFTHIGRDAAAAMEIAYRLGERVKYHEDWMYTEGEIKEIQKLSRKYSQGEVTISQDLAKKVACGLLTIKRAIAIQKDLKKRPNFKKE